MKLDDAINRDYAESAAVKLTRQLHPSVPEDVIRALYATGYTMGSLHGFAEARVTLEKTLMEYASGAAH